MLTSAFQVSANRYPRKTALAFGSDAWMFSEFHRLSGNIAQNLIAGSAEAGDRIALHLLNTPELALAVAGCLKAGLVVVPINTRLKGREIDYILRHSGSAFYIGEPQLYDYIAGSCPSLKELSTLYLSGPAGQVGQPFDHLLRTPVRNTSLPDVPALGMAGCAPDHARGGGRARRSAQGVRLHPAAAGSVDPGSERTTDGPAGIVIDRRTASVTACP